MKSESCLYIVKNYIMIEECNRYYVKCLKIIYYKRIMY